MLEDGVVLEDGSRLKTVAEDSVNLDEADKKSFVDQDSVESNSNSEVVRRTLSVESITNRRKKGSSMILNWLTNPENKIMYQGRSIDSRIFRSHSAVESRPLSHFTKSARFHSLRELENNSRNSARNGLSQRKGWICELELTRDSRAEITCSNIPVMTKDHIDADVYGRPQTVNREEIRGVTGRDCFPCETGQFASLQSDTMDENELSLDFKELNLNADIFENATSPTTDFRDHISAKSYNSLPNYGRTPQVKLRRMNSDALFYKGGYRNYDKRRSFESRKRRNRLSFQLRDLVEKDPLRESIDSGIQSIDSESSSELEVNSQRVINNIGKIFTCGDLQLIRELAECGFDFNAKDSSGNSALHYAALRGSEKIITEILEHGGNVWVRNNDNQLPVELASNMNVRMLLSGVTLFYRGQYSNEIESRLTSKQMSFEL